MTQGTIHCKCKTHHKVRLKKSYYPLLGSLLIAILPKCPFCIVAYTSAITVCSAKSLTEYTPEWTSYIPISLAMLTFCIVVWNYKGKKTIAACALILAGGILITYSELYSGQLSSYYWGSALLVMGVWVNGNFSYFVDIVTSRMGKQAVSHG
jgi:hypothetical protein